MNPVASSSIITVEPMQLHCQHRNPSGRRCRMALSDTDSGLCSRHAALRQKDLDQADVTSKIIGESEEFRSAVAINRSLGELYKLQARNLISPRRAAVMAYTANLLLRTLPAIEHELHPAVEGPSRFDFTNWPRPRDEHTPDPPREDLHPL
jgi:hypothetical protein